MQKQRTTTQLSPVFRFSSFTDFKTSAYPLSTTSRTPTLPSFATRLSIMEALPSQSLLQLKLPRSFRSPSCNQMDQKSTNLASGCIYNEQPKNAMAENLQKRFRPLTVKRMPRRLLLQIMGFNHFLFQLQPIFGAPMPEMKEPEVIRTLKLPSGVRIQEIIKGEGPEANEGNLVEINYVCRRSNGYFVHSTVDQFSGESSPIILPLDEKEIIKGLKDVLIGMRVGGKRRALIPPSLGYINENLKPIPQEFGPRRSLLSHVNEPLIFEVQLLKVL